ncbi:hypothetical protein BH11CYA1_BH11CYA1_23410 [soil metagenome]
MNSTYIAVILIVALIGFWCLFDSRSAPGITRLRPHGIAVMVVFGAIICLADKTSPTLIGIESFVASLVFLCITMGLTCLGVSDHPTVKVKRIGNAIFIALPCLVCATAYGLGAIPALIGAAIATAIMAATAVYWSYS